MVTTAVQLLFCAVLVVGGAALLFVGWLGMRGRLPRNRYAGVRTPAALRSDAAFAIANRVAAPATMASGAVAVLAGASLPLLATTFSVVLVAVLGVVGTVVLMVIGGVIGHRAADALPATPQPSSGCSGCACGGCGVSA